MIPLAQIPEASIFELVERLDVRGPRYTSYPTAPVWRGDFPADDYRSSLVRTGAAGAPLALYLHFPFCRQRCLYCGCNSVVSNDTDRLQRYLSALESEIDTVSDVLGDGARHAWLHLGGGTPTHVPADDLARVLDRLIERIPGANTFERSVEVDPRVTTDAHLVRLAERGFRRISMGVQDVEPAVQTAVNREYGLSELCTFVGRCRAHGFTGVNIDLIYGLPLQTRETWRRTLASVADLGPDRLACFGYAHLPGKIEHQREIKSSQLPPPRDRLGMLLDAFRFFEECGHTTIGLDHFAARDDRLAVAVREGNLWRNFMGYTDIRGLTMIGFGASSIGELPDLFVQNVTQPEPYNERLAAGEWPVNRGHRLDRDDQVRKMLINDLMCNLVVRVPAEAAEVSGLAAKLHDSVRRLTPYADEGLIEPAADGWAVTPLGRLFLRNLAMPFDRYLPDQDQVTFSRTV